MNRPLPILAVALILLLLPVHLSAQKLTMGSERMDVLLPLLRKQRVGLMVNQSSLVGDSKTHLLDSLIARGVQVSKVFVPEHGFRGDVDAGKTVRHGRDVRTGIPIVSLYGRVKRPTAEMLREVDVLLFDLQDVGVRFYTYISSMHYLMEAAAEQGKLMIVADRPNPNDYIDGPTLELDCQSFVGMHPIPTVHGLTVAELARMINGERWLRGKKPCRLEVIPMLGWRHGQSYILPVRPSPNLSNDRSIALYPSLCLFEATIMSVGRGTDSPFEVLGYPHKSFGQYSFVPDVKLGADTNPRYKGKRCYGVSLRDVQPRRDRLSLEWILHFAQIARRQGIAFIDRPRMFELLAGNKRLASQIASGLSEEEIRLLWQSDLSSYIAMRKKYLLYPDDRYK